MNNPFEKLVSLAIAHGITPRLVDTWFPHLPRTPRVMAPVNLEVLMVREGGGRWAQCGMRAPQNPHASINASDLFPRPFLELDQPRAPGAYLHWALPDALSHGKHMQQEAAAGTAAQTIFPSVPDRWLVLRLYPSAALGRRTVRGWVLQAGDANPAHFDLDGWREPGVDPPDVRKPLTALGHGDVSWAGYYDNVIDRMAFYDNLDGVAGPVSYLVCGWFSQSQRDPLGDPSIRSLTDFEARMRELRWSLPDKDFAIAQSKSAAYISNHGKVGLETSPSKADRVNYDTPLEARSFSPMEPGSAQAGPPYTTDGSWWPQHTLYHGSVLGIGWPGIGWQGNEQGVLSGEEGGPPAPEAVNVYVANSGPEALAALLAGLGASANQKRVFEAFQIGLLPDLDEPDGRARVDAGIHASTFGSIPGGDVFERIFQPPSGPPSGPPATPPQPEPGVFQRYQHESETGFTQPGKLKATKATPTEVSSAVFQAPSTRQEAEVKPGRLGGILAAVDPYMFELGQIGRWTLVKRPLPRFFHPTDPVVLMEGLKRSFQHGGDGRFAPDGSLVCRLTGACVHGYTRWQGNLAVPTIYPEDVLHRGVENGSVPPECEELLGEAALLDPGSAAPLVQAATRGMAITAQQFAAEVRHVMVDQTAWWSLRNPHTDHARVVAQSGFTGVLPSPVAVTPPVHPWSPLHLEWEVEYLPSAGAQNDWTLGELDYNESVPNLPPPEGAPGVQRFFAGRTPLAPSVNRAVAQAIRHAAALMKNTAGSGELLRHFVEQFSSPLAQRLLGGLANTRVPQQDLYGGSDRNALLDIATALESIDVLTSSFGGLHTRMRGGLEGDGVSAPRAGDPAPDQFILFRAGFLRIRRLRLVDAFGQFVDLAGSGAESLADPNGIVLSDTLSVPDRPELAALPPRFTAPARLWLRYMDAGGTNEEARLDSDTVSGISPVCGYLMPNHLDRAVAFYAADGADLGVIRVVENAIAWEDAPGRPSTVGRSPARAVSNRFLAGIAQGLIDWGLADRGFLAGPNNALHGMLRAIDSVLWSVDPFGHQGDEHLSLLIGHPVVVMRALVRLDVREPVNPSAANIERVRVRLGSLANWQDGMLGFFVNDDYTHFRTSAAAAAMAREIGPGDGFLQQINAVQGHYDQFAADLPEGTEVGGTAVQHPYVDTSGVIYLQPGQDVWLTLLVEPHTLVHATSGILPRKEIGMRREWVAGALSKLSPTFRFGPVLIDPQRIRMPVPHDIHGTWSWDHRKSVIQWANDPVVHATQDALLEPDAPVGSEGWLRLTWPSTEGG